MGLFGNGCQGSLSDLTEPFRPATFKYDSCTQRPLGCVPSVAGDMHGVRLSLEGALAHRVTELGGPVSSLCLSASHPLPFMSSMQTSRRKIISPCRLPPPARRPSCILDWEAPYPSHPRPFSETRRLFPPPSCFINPICLLPMSANGTPGSSKRCYAVLVAHGNRLGGVASSSPICFSSRAPSSFPLMRPASLLPEAARIRWGYLYLAPVGRRPSQKKSATKRRRGLVGRGRPH